MELECHLRVLCVHLSSLGLGLDPWRHFQTVGLLRAVTRRNCSFRRAWKKEQATVLFLNRMDDSLHPVSEAPLCS